MLSIKVLQSYKVKCFFLMSSICKRSVDSAVMVTMRRCWLLGFDTIIQLQEVTVDDMEGNSNSSDGGDSSK